MNTPNLERQAHSADVQMHLSVNGHMLSIGHLGPDYVILDDPIDHPPTDAQISLSVDGKERRWAVRLVEGSSASQARTRISVLS
jgi:hypothetical protein